MTAPEKRDEQGADADRAIGIASVDGAAPDDGSPVEGVVVGVSDVDTSAAEGQADDDALADSEESTGDIPVVDPDAIGGEESPAAGHRSVETPPFLAAEVEALRGELEETIKDLQRVSAEYANYRKRVERDRSLIGEQATGAVLAALLPVLDDLDRARDHGDLVGPFGAVAEQLNATVAKFGLAGFGDKGDPFDPTQHEAVAHRTSADVTEPTCVEVMRRGYMLGDRLLRPALVAVADPE